MKRIKEIRAHGPKAFSQTTSPPLTFLAHLHLSPCGRQVFFFPSSPRTGHLPALANRRGHTASHGSARARNPFTPPDGPLWPVSRALLLSGATKDKGARMSSPPHPAHPNSGAMMGGALTSDAPSSCQKWREWLHMAVNLTSHCVGSSPPYSAPRHIKPKSPRPQSPSSFVPLSPCKEVVTRRREAGRSDTRHHG